MTWMIFGGEDDEVYDQTMGRTEFYSVFVDLSIQEALAYQIEAFGIDHSTHCQFTLTMMDYVLDGRVTSIDIHDGCDDRNRNNAWLWIFLMSAFLLFAYLIWT